MSYQKGRMSLLLDKTELIYLIDKLLTDLLNQTKRIRRQPSPFDCKDIPNITILNYLKRIAKYSHCSSCVFVAALIYIDRLQQRIDNLIINYYNIHRLLISCIMVSAKFYDDFYYRNDFYAKLGGIGMSEINDLELQLMKTFDFSLFITNEEFVNYLQRIQVYKEINFDIESS